MTTTNEEYLVNYLEEQLEHYQNIYGSNLNKRFLKFYEGMPAPLDKLFAFFMKVLTVYLTTSTLNRNPDIIMLMKAECYTS